MDRHNNQRRLFTYELTNWVIPIDRALLPRNLRMQNDGMKHLAYIGDRPWNYRQRTYIDTGT